MSYPADLKYTKEHEWIRVEGDTGVIGITDFAQQQLGDVVYVELPDVGSQVTAGQSFGSIESVKAVSELFAPMSGEVAEVNPAPLLISLEAQIKEHSNWKEELSFRNT